MSGRVVLAGSGVLRNTPLSGVPLAVQARRSNKPQEANRAEGIEDKEHTIASAGGVFKSRRQFKYHPLAVSTAGYGRSEEVAHSVESHSVIQVGSVWSRAKGVEYALIPSATSVWR